MNNIKSWLFHVSALFSGIIFGIGLIIAGMVNPAKVISFLDIFGLWDPSLAFVMGGALLVALPAFFYAKNKTNILNQAIQFNHPKKIDKRLTLGSVVFGIGWGLAGICPGPVVLHVSTLSDQGLIFFIAMLFGFSTHQFISDY